MSRTILKWNIRKLVQMIVATLLNKFDFFIVIEGSTGCLTGDTIIRYNRGHNARQISLRKLYQFNEKAKNGKADKKFNPEIPTYIRAFNGQEVRLHRLKEVFYSGKQQVYQLILEDGKSIRTTGNHKFLSKNQEWKQLKDLKVGDAILCDTPNTKKNDRKRIKLRDIYLTATPHPFKNKHNELEVHRLIYEARLNNLGFLEYLDILLNEEEKSKQLKYVNPAVHVIHHKDGCHYNNSIDNLELLSKQEHFALHGNLNYVNFSQGIPKPVKIKEIIEKEIEDTYDIECEHPYHNFVANDIIVHNSGKSTLAFHICSKVAQEFRRLFRLNEDVVEYYYERVGKKMGWSEEEFVAKIMLLKTNKEYSFHPSKALIYTQDELQRHLASWHNIAIPDEMINITFNRDFYSEKQKDIIKMLNMFRDHENLTLACVPQFANLDTQIKNLTKMKITVKKRGVAIIHTPNSVVYSKDKWDQATNEKIEKEWIIKKISHPNYSKLTTFRGLIKFPPLTRKQEAIYQQIKNEKRSVVLKDDMHIKLEKSDDPVEKIIQLLIKEGIKNGLVIDGYALGLGMTRDQLRGRVTRELRHRGMADGLSYYYADKKAKNKEETEQVSALDGL